MPDHTSITRGRCVDRKKLIDDRLVRRANGVVWMMTMYPKNVADSIPAHFLRQFHDEVDNA